MAHIKVLVFRILFLVLIAHSLADRALVAKTVEQELRAPAELDEAPHASPLLSTGRDHWHPDDRGEDATQTPLTFEEAQDVKVELIGSREKARTSTNELEPQTTSSSSKEHSKGDPAEPHYADLCYLSNGGSSITLTVNEATQVGSVIGTLEVNGNPVPDGGNVELYDATDLPASSSNTNSALSDSSSAGSGLKRRILGRRSTLPGLLGLVSEPGQQASASGNFYSVLAGPASGLSPTAPNQLASGGPVVRIEPGTRNLILARPLDKESGEGDQSLLVQIRCRTRPPAQARSSPESFTIPVRIIVTDANDHAPEFVGQQPYQVNVSETTPIGSVVSRDILAIDRDSAGPFSTLHYRVLDENSPLQFANPLEPTLSLASPLDYESQGASFMLTIQVQDEGEPEPLTASAQVRVNIIDFDDQNPRFLDDKYTLIMDEKQQNSVGLCLQVLPRNLYAEDGDRGIKAPITYRFDHHQRPDHLPSGAGSPSASNLTNADELDQVDNYLHLNAASGEVKLIRQWPTSGRLASAPLTLVVRATQADNSDRYTLTTLTIMRPQLGSGSPVIHSTSAPLTTASLPRTRPNEKSSGLEFVSARLELSVAESTPVNETIGRVRVIYSGDPRLRPLASAEGHIDSQAESAVVELIGERQHSRSRPTRWATESAQMSARRSINYQILDDQTDQFGINNQGEIFIKRGLDYESRQEFRLRVLATYLKYSDICQVQVHVLNVNDNKPKFTQPQYTFQLTESRLRSSNVVGQVQAHDDDLNDTLRFSLVGGDFVQLFDINPSSGQISLKPSIRQLDVTSCQLLVQVTDSLATATNQLPHTSQARVHLHVAPQLIGRSLNLNQPLRAPNSKAEVNATARDQADLEEQHSSGQGGRLVGATRDRVPAPSNQRSSVATVMSSLQHMVRGVNFFDMPMSSAVLLSALLALLVCLLLVLVISMGVHIYKKRLKYRHQHHLAATAHLRRPNLALVHPASSTSNGSSPNSSTSGASSTLQTAAAAKSSRYLAARLSSGLAATSETRRAGLLGTKQTGGDLSIISSLTSNQSKRSYRSNTTDDSSVMHCGHYSVTASRRPSPSQRHLAGSSKGLLGPTVAEMAAAAIKSLVREANEEEAAEEEADQQAKQSRTNSSCEIISSPPTKLKVSANELTVLTNSKPGIKSYRKLPLGSLVRTQASPHAGPGCASNGLEQAATDSAIASDSSADATSSSKETSRGALMALIKEPQNKPQVSEIKWPTGAIPARVKRLTWDDELSLAEDHERQNTTSQNSVINDDCYFVAPDLRLMSPLSNHEYPIEGTADLNDHYIEKHFLFSHPSSPAGPTATLQANEPSGSQNNCLDYTIVQSSQFQVDSLRTDEQQPNGGRAHQGLSPTTSLSAQHHLLLQQGGERVSNEVTPYLSTTSAVTTSGKMKLQQSSLSAPTNPDLKLIMTTAVL